MNKRFELHWDESSIAESLRIPLKDVREYFTDGRRVSFLVERRVCFMHPGWSLAESEGAGYDLKDPEGGLWEVRSITSGGVYFNPSNQVGSGRKYDEQGFMHKIRAIRGFILTDIESFPRMQVFVVASGDVERWHKQGMLGSNARVSRVKFLSNLVPDIRG